MEPVRTLVALLVIAVAFAGCSGGDGGEPTGDSTTTKPPLAAGKGAVSGLLIDDVYRPVANALVLLQGPGMTATTNEQGIFQFLDLEPGSYIIIASAEGHEAAPVTVEVLAGQYSEVEIVGRRIFSDEGYTVTSEYSVFIPCAIDYVANGEVRDCTFDLSGESFRAGYTSDYTAYNATATYLIVEMKANKEGRYEVQLREDNEDSAGGERYAVAQFAGDYVRIQFKVGEVNQEFNGQGNNVGFNVTKPMALILFTDSQGREELQGLGLPVCCGAGVQFGIKARFVQTLFLGEPKVDVDTYSVLA